MEAGKSHPRWARATDNHVADARQALLDYINRSGRHLPGGVTADMVSALRPYDLLDIAQSATNDGLVELHGILDRARTLPESATDDPTST